MRKETVLGLSVGTQLTGLALTRNGTLDDWQVKSFEGKWTKIKLRIITLFVERYIKKHRVNTVILKIPELCRSSPAVETLTEALTHICERENVQVATCTINELKDIFEVNNKAELMQATLIHYPELTYMLQKAKLVKKIYYVKVFEAALATML